MTKRSLADEQINGDEGLFGALRVYVIDDDSDIRRSLHSSLGSAGIVAWPFASAQDFLEHEASLDPGPILLDVRMPGIGGIELLARLRKLEIDWPVIMMSAHGGIPIAVQSMKLGAVDFLEKPFNFGELELLLRKAHKQINERKASSLTRRQADAIFATLTPREAQVIDLLVAGAPNKTVASELGISLRTVETHRAKALEKLGVKSLALVVALKMRLLDQAQ